MCGEKFELSEDNSEVVLELAIDDADAARARAGDGQRSAAQAGRGKDELDEIRMPTPTNPSHDSPRFPPHVYQCCKA